LDPSLVLAIWAAGIAAGLALVASWRIVGPGYTWLASGVILLFGVPAALAGSGPLAWAGSVLALAAGVAARRPGVSAALAAVAGGGFVIAAGIVEYPVLAVSGALFLGGVTTEMMLGHWYLVDPRLPRQSLKRLSVIGAVGAVLDSAGLVAHGILPWASVDAVIGWAFAVLAATSVLLLVAVWFAIRERGYSGVMAATGLSYLAMLTAIGAMVLGRMLL
jgi:hypothetical protein